MVEGLIGKKIGMSQIYREDGRVGRTAVAPAASAKLQFQRSDSSLRNRREMLDLKTSS